MNTVLIFFLIIKFEELFKTFSIRNIINFIFKVK